MALPLKRLPVLLALALLVPAGSAAAAPRPLIVDPSGAGGRCDDARPADAVTAAQPLCTIAAALRAAQPGQTVFLRRGTHAAATVADVGGTGPLPVRVRPWTGEESRVDSRGIFLTAAHDLVISGVTATTLQLRTADRVQLTGNDVHSILLRDVDTVRVTGNEIHDGPLESAGVLVQGIGRITHRLVVADNRIRNLTGDGIDIYNGASGVRLQRNEISDLNLAPGSSLHVDAIQFMPGDHYQILDNYIHDAIHGVLISGGRSSSVRMTGNRLVRVGGNPVQLFGTPRAVFCHNVVEDKLAGTWAPSLYVGHDANARSYGVVVGENDFGHWKAEAGTLADVSVGCPA